MMNFDDPIAKALRYVGSYGCHEEAGAFQFDLMRREGVAPSTRFLEIGAGCLNLGSRLIDYLDGENYTAIEPNEWLVAAGRDFFAVSKPFRHITATNFDAGSTFDFIYSHSVLSHASRYQLPEYFAAVKRQLAPGGKALASIRFSESHIDRTRDRLGDSDAETWDYPNITWFTHTTVARVAREHGLRWALRPDIRQAFMAATNGEHEHDWIELT